MKRFWLVALALLASGATTLHAQGHWLDLGVNGGIAYWTKILDGDDTGGDPAKFSPGWIVGAQATYWPGTRLGFRANPVYTTRDLKQGDTELVDGINLIGLTGDLVLRLRDPNEGNITPFVAAGLGARWVRPSGTYIAIDNPNGKYWEGDPFVTSNGSDFFAGQLTTLLGLVSVGADIGRSRVGFRVEAGDRFFHPHFHQIADVGGGDPPLRTIINDGDEKLGPWVHELFAQAGIVLRIGGTYPERVVMAPPPATPPPSTPTQPPPQTPAPPPPAPPAPSEERLSVCVVEGTGVRMVDALYRPASRDTVTASGRAAFRASLTPVRTASSASWYTSGAPVRVSGGGRTLEWTMAGSPEMLGSDVVALGTIDGITLYARGSDVAAMRARFDGRAATPLATTLGSDRALWTALEDVRTVYVVMDQVGCRFQPLQVRRPTTKGG